MLTAIPEIIVGVAIAIALIIPPLTTVGIGLGLGSAEVVGTSFVLLSNIFGLI
jgi:uncharacterized membrane protein